jgi:dTDP-4-dehydrorhamnose 3,5-epimerase-like enzyme
MSDTQIKELPVEELKIGDKVINVEKASVFGDDRGFFTAINFEPDSKRAYLIQNHKAGIVRAFHGHERESKTLYVIRGSFKVICINMATGDWKKFTINERSNNMIKIPAKAYNGFVSLTDDSELLVVSSSTFEESKGDDIRLPYDILGKQVWEVEHR